MSFQGHIENGVVVLDEPMSLGNGTIVRIEPVETARKPEESSGVVVADTDQPCTTHQMAQAWRMITKPIPEDSIHLSVDPDDYPLF